MSFEALNPLFFPINRETMMALIDQILQNNSESNKEEIIDLLFRNKKYITVNKLIKYYNDIDPVYFFEIFDYLDLDLKGKIFKPRFEKFLSL